MLRRLLVALGALLAALVVVLAGAFAYAQTETGRDQISGIVARQLSTPEQQAEVQNLGGLLPFDIRLGTFRLRDAQGPWLEVDDARLELAPTALLRGEVVVRQVGARRVAVN